MKINAIDIKPGNVLEHQNKLWIVLKRELVQPGKGGSFAQVEMRDLRGGSKLSERFRTQESVERVRLDEKGLQLDSVRSDDHGVLILFARSAPMPLAGLGLDAFSPTSEVGAIDVMWRSNVRPLAFSLHDAAVAEFFEQRARGTVRHV